MKKGFGKKILSSSLLAILLAGSLPGNMESEAATTMTFNVTGADFGADGTDLMSDAVQIQKALDTARSIEGTVNIKVPAGTYYLDRKLTIYSNTNLMLDDETIIKRMPGYSSVMLMNGSDYSGVTEEYEKSGNISVSGGTWDGTVAEGSENKEEKLFYFGHGYNISLDNILIKNGYGPHLVEFTGVNKATVTNVTLKNYLGEEGRGAEALAFTVVTGDAKEEFKPYDYTPCMNITVTNCEVSYPSGISVYSDTDGSAITNITIQENVLSNLTGTGIVLTGCEGADISLNTISASPEIGISAEESLSMEIYSNTIANCKKAGIYAINSKTLLKGNVLSGCEGTAISIKNPLSAEITGNRVKDNPNGDGITIVNGNYATKITDNYISDVGDYGIIMYYGEQTNMTNNTITNFKKCGISIQKSLSENERSSSVTIHSNKISNGETGIEVVYADQSVISNNIIKDTTVAGIVLSADCENSTVKRNQSDAPIEILDETAVLTDNVEGTNGLVWSEEDGQLYYYKNGKPDPTYTGLAQYENIWYYLEKGAINREFSSLYYYKGIWYYVNQGVVDFTYTGLVKYNGGWFYVEGGTIAWSYTGLAKNEAGWFYVKSGKIDWSYTGLVKYYNVWFYVNKGTLDRSYAGLVKYNNAWYYVEKGQINWKQTSLVKHNGLWFYVENGAVNFKYTGLVKHNGGWFYVKSGAIDWSYTGLVKHNNAWFYVKGGVLDWSYTGLVKRGSVWYYVKGGVLDFSHTGMLIFTPRQFSEI